MCYHLLVPNLRKLTVRERLTDGEVYGRGTLRLLWEGGYHKPIQVLYEPGHPRNDFGVGNVNTKLLSVLSNSKIYLLNVSRD